MRWSKKRFEPGDTQLALFEFPVPRLGGRSMWRWLSSVLMMSPEPREGFDPSEEPPDAGMRHVELVPASSIKVKPVHWLWKDRIPVGELTLLAGREGIGKSTIAYTMAAWITTGTMKGRFEGEPRSVLVAATEDSWEHTIVPRLMAAGADLDRVFRIDVVTEDGFDGLLTLPSDISSLFEVVARSGAAMLLLDPLISRLSAHLDSHKDAEVRIALEPLTAFAKRARISVLGIIHVNKSGSADALNSIMGSRAFGSVARAVLMAVKNPEDGSCTFGLAKNNLGSKDDLPAYCYQIVGQKVADTDEGEVWTGKVEWQGDADRSVDEVIYALAEGGMDGMSAVDEAAGWLEDYLNSVGWSKASSIVKSAGLKQGHKAHNLNRAAAKLKIRYDSEGFPRTTVWTLPADLQRAANGDNALETLSTVTTVPTTSHTHIKEHASPFASGDSGDSTTCLQSEVLTGEPR
jgi:energy-coupling factor transporter ATP-binding protein EcfA2